MRIPNLRALIRLGKKGQIQRFPVHSKKTYRSRYHNRGMGLLLILVMLGVVAMVAGSIALRVQRSSQAGASQNQSRSAEDAAFSGLQVSIAGVTNTGDTWGGTGGPVALPHRTELAYQVVVNSNFSGEEPLEDSDGTLIPPEAIYVKSLGSLDGVARSGLSAIVAQQRGMVFNYPAFGASSLALDNSLVQAVDSGLNPVAKKAPIRTNSQDSQAITLRNESYVDGDVTVGPGGDPNVALYTETGSGFSGDADTAGSELPLPQVTAGYSDTAPDIGAFNIPLPIPIPFVGLFFVNMSMVVVPPGTYNTIDFTPTDDARFYPELARFSSVNFGMGDVYCNKLVSSGGDVISVTTSGPALIHVRDEVTFNAVSTTFQGTGISDFQIYQTESGGQVQLNNTMGRLVLASQGPVSVQNSNLLGALYGSTVSLKDTTLSYPKDLDGQVLNDKVRRGWKAFGIKTMTPEEIKRALP